MKDVPQTLDLPEAVRHSPNLARRLRAASTTAFPGGRQDIEREARALLVDLRGRLPLSECEKLVEWAKPLAAITYDPSGDVLRLAVGHWLAGYFSPLMGAAFAFVVVFRIRRLLAAPASPAVIVGGHGESARDPIVVLADDTGQAVSAMYGYLGRLLGPSERWRIEHRRSQHFATTTLDCIGILVGRERRTFYFRLDSRAGTSVNALPCPH